MIDESMRETSDPSSNNAKIDTRECNVSTEIGRIFKSVFDDSHKFSDEVLIE